MIDFRVEGHQFNVQERRRCFVTYLNQLRERLYFTQSLPRREGVDEPQSRIRPNSLHTMVNRKATFGCIDGPWVGRSHGSVAQRMPSMLHQRYLSVIFIRNSSGTCSCSRLLFVELIIRTLNQMLDSISWPTMRLPSMRRKCQ